MKNSRKPTTEWIQIQLRDIAGVHSAIAQPASHFAAQSFQMSNLRSRSGKSYLSEDALAALERVCPISVVRERQKYYCVAGLRTFQIFKALRPLTDQIRVQCFQRLPTKEREQFITELALVDEVIAPAIKTLTPRPAKALAELLEQFPRDQVSALLPNLKSKSALAHALGVDRSTLKRPSRKSRHPQKEKTR